MRVQVKAWAGSSERRDPSPRRSRVTIRFLRIHHHVHGMASLPGMFFQMAADAFPAQLRDLGGGLFMRGERFGGGDDPFVHGGG